MIARFYASCGVSAIVVNIIAIISVIYCVSIYYNAVPTDIGACVRRRSVASRALPIWFNSASVVSPITSSVIAIITVLTVDSIFYKTVPTFVTVIS